MVSVTNVHPYIPNRIAERQADPHPGPDILNGGEEYEVEKILDSRYRYGRLWYFVKFSGWPNLENEWLPRENLENSPDLIKEFHQAHPEAPRPAGMKGPHRPRTTATSRRSGIEGG